VNVEHGPTPVVAGRLLADYQNYPQKFLKCFIALGMKKPHTAGEACWQRIEREAEAMRLAERIPVQNGFEVGSAPNRQ
jgi:hypothetical protein